MKRVHFPVVGLENAERPLQSPANRGWTELDAKVHWQ